MTLCGNSSEVSVLDCNDKCLNGGNVLNIYCSTYEYEYVHLPLALIIIFLLVSLW